MIKDMYSVEKVRSIAVAGTLPELHYLKKSASWFIGVENAYWVQEEEGGPNAKEVGPVNEHVRARVDALRD